MCLHLLWIDERKKKGERWRKKRKVIRPFGEEGKKKRSPCELDWGQCSLEELCEWEQAKKKRKIERVRENCERYTGRKRVMSEKKKKVFFAQVTSLSVVISI